MPAEWIADQERRGRTLRVELESYRIWINPPGSATRADRAYVQARQLELYRLLVARDPDVARQAQRIAEAAQARGVLPKDLLAAAQRTDPARQARGNDQCGYCLTRRRADPGEGSCCWVCRRALSVATGWVVVGLEPFCAGRASA